ncbi:uncharacterized protein DS421_15g518860 [Arachis hypogaea]|nr:uncharacterized protein DS421_15g518860 [Arachis hypogaea]
MFNMIQPHNANIMYPRTLGQINNCFSSHVPFGTQYNNNPQGIQKKRKRK